ncbi:MAG: DUF4258 domain-containing protein [Patescibacteria group bacterium]
MKFSFTHHAQFRIMERGISTDNIKKVLQNPDMQRKDVYGMMIANKKIGAKFLEVVYKTKGSEYIIITAYYEN